MELYVHTQGLKLALQELEPTAKVASIASTSGQEGSDVWLQDAEEPLDPDLTIEQAGIGNRGHVHVSTCKRIEVTVRFLETDKSHAFPPGATVAAVLAWATGPLGFDLPDRERVKHLLAACDANEPADKNRHVGSYATDACTACFDLVPKERFEG